MVLHGKSVYFWCIILLQLQLFPTSEAAALILFYPIHHSYLQYYGEHGKKLLTSQPLLHYSRASVVLSRQMDKAETEKRLKRHAFDERLQNGDSNNCRNAEQFWKKVEDYRSRYMGQSLLALSNPNPCIRDGSMHRKTMASSTNKSRTIMNRQSPRLRARPKSKVSRIRTQDRSSNNYFRPSCDSILCPVGRNEGYGYTGLEEVKSKTRSDNIRNKNTNCDTLLCSPLQ